METKEKNMGEEKSTTNEELLNKREVLSDEALKEVAGGEWGDFDDSPLGCNCVNPTTRDCRKICCQSREDCPR